MNRSRTLLAVLLCLLCLVSPVSALEQLVIAGTGDSQHLLRQVARSFEKSNPGTRIVVPDSIGSSGGVKALISGKCDIARVARPLKARERAAAADLVYHHFASTPVVFVANLADKCVDNLNPDQVVAIFSGEITDWSNLGRCQSHKIYVAMREMGDSSRSVIESSVPRFAEIDPYAGKVIYSTPETARIIADFPYTIGYLPMISVPPKMAVFSYNGVAPSEAAIRDGTYSLTTPLGLVWRGELSPLGERFVSYLSSPAGRAVIRAQGAVAVR